MRNVWCQTDQSLTMLTALAVLSSATVFPAFGETVVSEIAPGVFARKAQMEPTFDGCNQGWVVFNEFVLVIDANTPSQADGVIKLIQTEIDKPIRYVLDTHYHWDHADGNGHYKKLGAEVIAADSSRALFETKGRDFFKQSQQKKTAGYGELDYKMPSLYFDRTLVFDDGDQRVELLHFGHGHTAGDVVAWVPKYGILFTGDACVNGAFNYMGDSNTEGWIGVLEAMQELPVKVIVPGHGELAGKELLATQERYVVELRSTIQAAIEGGRTLQQIKKEIDLPFYVEWTGVSVRTRVGNIEHVYRELKEELSQ